MIDPDDHFNDAMQDDWRDDGPFDDDESFNEDYWERLLDIGEDE